MARLRALCVVAHPDDCIIFARPFIDAHPQFEWRILYLTYAEFEPRGREIKNYWKTQDILTIHLGYVDTYLDMENNKLSFNSEQAAREIIDICKEYDLILTHNADGDYGHIHHEFVSMCVTNAEKPTVYFGKYEQRNLECMANGDVDLFKLPLHKEVIEQFEDINTGRYIVTEAAREVINGKSETGRNVYL